MKPCLFSVCLVLVGCSSAQSVPTLPEPEVNTPAPGAASGGRGRLAKADKIRRAPSLERLPGSQRCLTSADRSDSLRFAYDLCEDPPEGFGGLWPYSFEWRGCVHQAVADQCGAAPRSEAPLQGRALELFCDESAPALSFSGCAIRHAAAVRESYQATLDAWTRSAGSSCVDGCPQTAEMP